MMLESQRWLCAIWQVTAMGGPHDKHQKNEENNVPPDIVGHFEWRHLIGDLFFS